MGLERAAKRERSGGGLGFVYYCSVTHGERSIYIYNDVLVWFGFVGWFASHDEGQQEPKE